MKRLYLLVLIVFPIMLTGSGCTSEDKRQWNEALREWRGENIRFGSRSNLSP